eukprot:6427479-Ditylum_brightwellii.AAC.1
MLFVCGANVTEACGAKQLCAGHWLDIEEGIHKMDDLWGDFGDDENWGILLVDARNAFNKLNCMAMLWHAGHIWTAGSQYSFNMYLHWKMLVVRGGNNLFSKEGVMQGGLLGNRKDIYIQEKVAKWVKCAQCFLPMVQRNPQAMHTELLPALLDVDHIDDSFAPLFLLPVKSAGIGTLSPIQELPLYRATSLTSTVHLKQAILQEHPLNLQDHDKCMNNGQEEGEKEKERIYKSILEQATSSRLPDVKRSILHAKKCSMWLNILPHYCNSMDLPEYCDGCNNKFSLSYALECMTGGLIIAQHDKIRNELAQVGSQAYSCSAISDKPTSKMAGVAERPVTARTHQCS